MIDEELKYIFLRMVVVATLGGEVYRGRGRGERGRGDEKVRPEVVW